MKRCWLIMGVAGIVALAGCGDDGGTDPDPEPTPASLVISPISLDFGGFDVLLSSNAVTFTVTNTGDDASSDLSTVIGGADASDFAVTADTCAGNTLAGGATCTVDVTFTAGAVGNASGSVTVSASAGGSASSTLTGAGNAPGSLTVSPTPHNFGSVVIGATGATQVFTVTNNGGSDSGAITAALSGGDAVMHSITENTCTASVVAGASCSITVDFSPTTAGAKATTLLVNSAAAGSTSAGLSGTGLDDARLVISPLAQNFGTITEGTSSVDVTFTVANTGDVASGAITSGLGGADVADYTVVTNNCGAALAADASCTIIVNFSPAVGSLGSKLATVDATATPGGTVSSALSGTSNAAGLLTITPSVGSFGSQLVGTSTNAQTFTVQNTGGTSSGVLTSSLLGSNPGDFPVSNGCTGQNLAGGASCDVSISFSPTASGTRSASFSVTSPNAGATSASLNGTGLAPAVLVLTPPTQNFGSVPEGSVGSPVTFTLANTGNQTSGVPAVSIIGTDFTQYSIFANGCTAGVPGGSSCDIQVTFSPTTQGATSATLEVSGTPGGTDSSAMIGTGTAPAALAFASSATVNLGTTIEDDSSASATVTVENTGPETTGVLDTSLANPAEFTIGADTCDGNTLAQNQQCTIAVTFTPTLLTLVNTNKSTDLVIAGTPGGSITAALSGISAPKFTVAGASAPPSAHSFGTLNIGATTSDPFTVTNPATTTNDARTFSATIINDANGEFAFVSNGCDGTTVNAGGNCVVNVSFTPDVDTAPGARTATLRFTADGTTQSIDLSGNANGFLQIDPLAQSYGLTELVGSTSVRTFTVTNNSPSVSSGPLSTSLTTADNFEVQSDACAGTNLAPGAPCDIVVRFFPLTATSHEATLTVEGSFESGAGSVSSNLTGTAIDSAELSIDAGTGAFGSVIATNSATQTFTVRNTGDVTIAANTISVATTGDPSFSVVIANDNCTDQELVANAPCTVEVRFNPANTAALGAKTGTLTVSSSGVGGSDSVSLSGTATSQLTVTGSGAFGPQVNGVTSSPRSFTVTNVSANAITTGIVPSASGAFSAATTCVPPLTAGQTCNVTATFTPTAGNSANFTGTLTVSSSVPGGNDTAALSGTGLTPATVTLESPNSQNFGTQAVNTTGVTRSFTFRNTGEVDTTALTTTGTSADFAISNTCTGNVLTPNESCSVTVAFAPQTAGSKNQGITVGATTGGSHSLTFTGTAINAATELNITPALNDFGPIEVEVSSGSVTYTVSNPAATASGAITVPAAAGDFNVSNDTCLGASIAAGGNCTFRVTFAPTVAGAVSVQLSVTENGGQTLTAQLEGTGLAPANIAAAGNNAFGNVAVGASETRTYTVSNSGDVASATPTVGLTGAFYSLANNTCTGPLTAAGTAGDKCTFDVTFAPGQNGLANATVTITGTANRDLAGTGVTPVTLSVNPILNQDCGTAPAGLLAGEGVSCTNYAVTNNGGVASGDLGVSLSDSVNFEITSDSCDTGAADFLGAGNTCTIVVAHRPQDVATNHIATLSVSEPSIATVNRTMNGIGVSALSTPTSGAFGDVVAGTSSTGRSFTITNAANTPTTGVLSVDLGGASPGEFSVASNCSGTSLPAGSTCTVTVTFVPTSVGNNKQATVDISDGSGSANKTLSIAVNGNGTAAP